MKATAQIFLSYAREDEDKVEKLYQKLSNAGFKPWMDKKDILPGERWQSSIRKAIRRSDFFMACLTANSVNKRGWIQREIKDALDIWQEKLDSDIYLIPVRLEDCEVPESLGDFQWVSPFEEDGWTRLVKAIQVGMKPRAEVAAPEEDSEQGLFGDLWSQFVPLADAVRILDKESKKVIDPLEERLSTAFDLINRESKPEEWGAFIETISDFCQYTSSTQVNKTSVKELKHLVAELVSKIIVNLSNYKHLASIKEQLGAIVHWLRHS